MTIFLQRASQQYAARQNPYVVSGSIPAGKTVYAIKLTLTREAWPAGPCGSATLTFPDGSTALVSFSGGDIPTRDGTGTLAASSAIWYPPKTTDEQGNVTVAPFPTGAYSMSFQVLQTLTTAVTLEYF